MPAYGLTIFIGAFLLFQVQPLIAKFILPWFGGGPGVWTTCMLFFQALLLAGYAYAHWIVKHLRPRAQVMVHLALAALALRLLPITPSAEWKPRGGGNPTFQILSLLAASLGLPYFVLSGTGPLFQDWFRRVSGGRSPYRLYALSNAGSLLALVSFPFLFEPHFTRVAQARLWSWGMAAYAAACALCARQLWQATKAEGTEPKPDLSPPPSHLSPLTSHLSPPTAFDRILWLLLPACASVLLLATTNKICLDVAVIPFLWILPLGLYLLSFIICFDSPRWYSRFPYAILLVVSLAGVCRALFAGSDLPLMKQLGIYAGNLLVCCLVCHGELYRRRPEPQHLTSFYVMIAAGGALGGLFVALLAPAIFLDFYELHFGLVLCGLLFVVACASERPVGPAQEAGPGREWRWLAVVLPLMALGGLDWFLAGLAGHSASFPKSAINASRVALWGIVLSSGVALVARGTFKRLQHWRGLTCTWLAFGVVGLGVALWSQAKNSGSEAVHRSRNFYGLLTVHDYRRTEPTERHLQLQHGRITHGLQFADPTRARWPTTYYGESSGVGLALRALPAGPRHIGLVGLGTGTLAAYGRTGDKLRVYEINPEVLGLATSWFTYVSNCVGRVEVVLGDARLSLERESSQQFDLLALDAFSSDAIPAHLLTRESFEVYGRHLRTNGVLAVHISNHYLDLEPVVANLAREFGYQSAMIDFEETDDEWWLYASTWILLTHDIAFLNTASIREAASPFKSAKRGIPLWTDDFVSLFQILK